MRTSIVMLITLVLAGCDPLSDERDELRAARERWDDADIHSYSYTFEYSCFCQSAGAYAVVVEDDSIASIEVVDGEWEGQEPYALTVPEMFDRIEQSLEREPDDVSLDFADEGYPEFASFDMIENAADDEWALGVDGFVALDGAD